MWGVYKRGRSRLGNGDCGQARPHVRRCSFTGRATATDLHGASGRPIHRYTYYPMSSLSPDKTRNMMTFTLSRLQLGRPRDAVIRSLPSSIRNSGKGGPGKSPRIKNSAYDCVTEGVITSINCLYGQDYGYRMPNEDENACKWMSRHAHSGKESLNLIGFLRSYRLIKVKQNRSGEME